MASSGRDVAGIGFLLLLLGVAGWCWAQAVPEVRDRLADTRPVAAEVVDRQQRQDLAPTAGADGSVIAETAFAYEGRRDVVVGGEVRRRLQVGDVVEVHVSTASGRIRRIADADVTWDAVTTTRTRVLWAQVVAGLVLPVLAVLGLRLLRQDPVARARRRYGEDR